MSVVRLAVMVVSFVSLVVGCSARDNLYIKVTDPETPWTSTGFSVKAPSDLGWYKAPMDDSFPNAIVFFTQEGKIFRPKGNYWYMKGTQVIAASSQLDEPVSDRKDKMRLAEALQEHLKRHQYFWGEKITKAAYEQLSGLDCVSYSATPIQEILSTKRGDLYQGEIKGYFCLHPDLDTFGVLMKSRDVATAGTNITSRTLQAQHFFKSLRFTSVSSPVSPSFFKAEHRAGVWLPWPYFADTLDSEGPSVKDHR